MGIKTVIKNDLWRVNYIVSFVKRHQADDKGPADLAKYVFRAYRQIHPVKGKERPVRTGSRTKAILEQVDITFDINSQFVYFLDTAKTIALPGNVLSNFPLAYGKIIHGVFSELVNAAAGSDDYGRETALVAQGVESLAWRIKEAVAASDLPEEIKHRRCSDFSRMLTTPAAHFDEALQRILFFNQIMWQTRHRLNGLGRLDVVLDELYRSDVAAGVLDSATAGLLIEDFLKQLSKYADYKSEALKGDIGQIIILGGLQEDGTYFCNDLTELFLRAQAKLRRPDPKTLLRVSSAMPARLLQTACECLLASTGSPLFSNDDVVIPALLDFGMPDEDAYDYCVSACWEPFICGRSLDQNNISTFDFFASLDELLNSGREFGSFSELLDAYIHCNEKRFKHFVMSLDELKWAEDPLVSLFTDDCNAKRLDISEGGARYNNYGVTTVGMASAINSLLNIQRAVFQEKRYTLRQLNEARCKNFAGCDEMFAYLQAEPSFGHDDRETAEITNCITRSVYAAACDHRNRYGGVVKIGLSSPAYNTNGRKAPADLAGRKQGDYYAPHISCADVPYTELVNFAGQLQYDKRRFNGNVVDFFVTPGFIRQNLEAFAAFIRGGIDAGFFQMQMNVMDSKTLIDAKRHPEDYAGLIVRVWGFSAYFNDLPDSYKDLLIQRAVAAERAV